ncbi:MAG TPA: glycosyltransferase family 39 protein, partial [Anaerolineae bacterium]
MADSTRGAGRKGRLGWLMVVLMMLAMGLRVADLQRRPLHFDEAINVTMGQRSPAGVLSLSRQTFDNDPPGHRFALGIWMASAGPSPLAIRIFSVFFGLLAVALTYRVSREMHLGFWPSLAAAGLLAISPYAIDYAQQAKGYAMGIGMAMLSWWMWLRLFKSGEPAARRLVEFITYICGTALALSTHYYALFLLPMQWLWVLGATMMERRALTAGQQKHTLWTTLLSTARDLQMRQKILQAVAAQAIACVPIGAWLALMETSLLVSTQRSSSTMQRTSTLTFIARLVGEMSVGQFASPGLMLIGTLGLVTALAVGAVRLWRWKSDASLRAFWFGLAFLVPVAGALAMQYRVSFFFPRFLLYALPNACVFIAGCVLPAQSKVGAVKCVPALAVAALSIAGLATFYTAPIDSADDYRPIVSQARPLVKPGDAALGAYVWMEGMFISYAPETAGTLRWYTESYSPDTVDTLLYPIAQSSQRILSLNFQRDPDASTTLSVAWLKQHTAYAYRFSSGATSILLFDTHSTALTGTLRSAVFDSRIRLDYSFNTYNAQPGDTTVVTLRWSALRKSDSYSTIYIHLISPEGQLVAQNDGDAVNGLAPAFTWDVGKPVIDRRAIL